MSPSSRPSFASRRRACAGVSRLGLAVMLFLLSLLGAIVVPVLQQRLRLARANETARLLTTFARTFAAAAKNAGDWPAAPAAPGELPPGPGLDDIAEAWRRPTPVGGHFQWIAQSPQAGARIRAGITISPTPDAAVSTDRTLFAAIDAVLDDGDLATGKFRLGYRARPCLILEP